MNLMDKIEKEHIASILNKTNVVIEEEVKEGEKKEEKKDEKKSKISKIQRIIYQEGKDFSIGDLIKIYYKIIENKKERIQIYEGNIIAVKGKGLSTTMKVRKVSYGVGVERTFPLYSPNIAKIEVVRKGKVRRAKLYYLRSRSGKSAIIKEKINFKKHK